MKPKIGLFAGGIETYWKDCGMVELPDLLQRDAIKLAERLGQDFHVVYPGIAGNTEESIQRARAIRDAGARLVVVYHATYVDDAMSLAVIDELGPDTFTCLLHSQGAKGIPDQIDLIEAGTTWGNNFRVQEVSAGIPSPKPTRRQIWPISP